MTLILFAVFNSGFVEVSSRQNAENSNQVLQPSTEECQSSLLTHDFDDSDDSEDDMAVDDDEESDFQFETEQTSSIVTDPPKDLCAVENADKNILEERSENQLGTEEGDGMDNSGILLPPHPAQESMITQDAKHVPSRGRFIVPVRDVALPTFYALLYYVRVISSDKKTLRNLYTYRFIQI
jgi:hypothetical protein